MSTASIFRFGYKHNPNWVPQVPKCSFSTFPANVVIAMPSVRIDRNGAPTPFMAIENDGNNAEDSLSLISRYTSFKDNELTRLKKLKKNGLVSALNRKMKNNGARYPVSGLVDTLCLLIFEWVQHPLQFG